MRLSGKVTLVTGGTRGIGRTLVERFAEAGSAVVFTGRSKDAGDQVEAEARERGLNVRFANGSAMDEGDVQAAVELAVSEFGSLTTIVNNAAATHLTGPGRPDTRVTDITTEVFDEVMRVGLYGTFWACKYGIPHMVAAGGGAIINISAASSTLAIQGRPAYQASKGAINSLTRQMAVDYGKQSIRSNAIIVGFTNTGGVELQKMIANEAFLKPVLKSIMLPRVGRSDDIANGAIFLASDEGEFITGILMPVDGGFTCHLEVPDTSALAAFGD
ncbi:MAG: putative oxidoreductase, short-chain dehydrogenase/reductase [Pseudonocardiales bacterium]|nr:putative oxidoreductase, short-chain dehydrogenase/reductase [Pseudonocardiales bacterium]